jgi:thiol-disulfide isomerase/thioredoxin
MLRALLFIVLAAVQGTVLAQSLKPWSGGRAPALELADPDGAVHRLADHHGKVVLVNFWATWCGPCREEMPSIERLRSSLQGRPFVVLGVNVGESARVAREYAEKLPIGFTVLLDRDTRAAKAWGARVLPASYLVGPDGGIRYSYFGDLDWSSAAVRARIEELLPKDKTRGAQR